LKRILGIETSCDETAAAVYEEGKGLISSLVSSQVEIHSRFGGVVPELASRRHLEMIHPIIEEALARAGMNLSAIEGIAVTVGPGLIGSLLVGLSVAKSVAYVQKIPFVGVNHLEGHTLAALLEDSSLTYPFTALVASGGHTHLFHVPAEGEYRLLGRTRDDAVGEAFDKVAKILGLGYPGGPIIEKVARLGNPQYVRFPRGMTGNHSFDFSFSGLKTAVHYHIEKLKAEGADPQEDTQMQADIAASFQQAAIEMCAKTAVRAAKAMKSSRLVLAGGVACNNALRSFMLGLAQEAGMELYSPQPALCTDNAAMIAFAGWLRLNRGERSSFSLNASARLPLA
jgi:tRNA N6-adenosine threonylcarbamoyltransferase